MLILNLLLQYLMESFSLPIGTLHFVYARKPRGCPPSLPNARFRP